MPEVVTPTFHLVPQLRMSHFIASFNYFLFCTGLKTTATDDYHEIHLNSSTLNAWKLDGSRFPPLRFIFSASSSSRRRIRTHLQISSDTGWIILQKA